MIVSSNPAGKGKREVSSLSAPYETIPYDGGEWLVYDVADVRRVEWVNVHGDEEIVAKRMEEGWTITVFTNNPARSSRAGYIARVEVAIKAEESAKPVVPREMAS